MAVLISSARPGVDDRSNLGNVGVGDDLVHARGLALSSSKVKSGLKKNSFPT